MSKIFDAIRTLVVMAKRLRGFSFSKEAEKPLPDLVSLVTFRQLLGENRPPLIGFIGCTGSGKSTLFNSLAGRTISATGWRVHNTRGPVIFTQAAMLDRLKELETNGNIAKAADTHYAFMGATHPDKLEDRAREVGRSMLALGVNTVVLAPV